MVARAHAAGLTVTSWTFRADEKTAVSPPSRPRCRTSCTRSASTRSSRTTRISSRGGRVAHHAEAALSAPARIPRLHRRGARRVRFPRARRRPRRHRHARHRQARRDHDGCADAVRSGHDVQQLLRVRHATRTTPARNAKAFKPTPWSVAVDGVCGKPGVYTLEDILKPHPLEERVYRHRCVEAWSMVMPWVGFPLGDLLKRFEPAGNAEVRRVHARLRRSEQMPERGRSRRCCRGPTSRGCAWTRRCIRSTLLAVGLYGEELPNQNGAPLRLVVAVEVRLQEHQVDREDPLRREAADDDVDEGSPRVLRVLREREPAVTTHVPRVRRRSAGSASS